MADRYPRCQPTSSGRLFSGSRHAKADGDGDQDLYADRDRPRPIAQGISARAFEGRYATRRRLLFHSPRGTYSVLPSRIDPKLAAGGASPGLERLGQA